MNRYKIPVSILVILLIAAGAGVYFWLSGKDAPGEEGIPPVLQQSERPTLAIQKSALSTKATFKAPEIKATSTISSSDIPSKLAFITASLVNPIDLKIIKITSKDGKSGYMLSYKTENSQLMGEYDKHISLFTSNKWEIVTGLRSNLASIIEAKSSSYEAGVSQSQIGQSVETDIILLQL